MELNKVLLVGNLGRDPEMKYLPSGDPVADFSVAVNRTYKDRQGERKEETTWVNISCFGKTAEFCGNYLKKGKAILVEGRLRTQSWETPEGQKRSKTEVVADRIQFASPRSAEEGGSAGPSGGQQRPASEGRAAAAPEGAGREETVDDLPF